MKQDNGFVKFAKAAWAYIKLARVELLVLLGIFVLDMLTKALVGRFMYVGQSIGVLPNFLYITYVRNTKAAFGSAFGLEKVLGDEGIRIIFLIVTLLAMGVFSYILYRCRRRHILMRLSIAMILAGALGNFVDRLFLKYVRDFVHIHFFGCDVPLLGSDFPVFNVADMGLTVGVVLFLVYFIAIFKDPKKPTQEETASADESATNADGSASSEDENDESSDVSPEEQAAQSVSGNENENTVEPADTGEAPAQPEENSVTDSEPNDNG